MKKILMFDTSYSTRNMGDYIINESINREMKSLLNNNFVVRTSTHVPIGKWYQKLKVGGLLKYSYETDLKFLCGTNLFKKTLIKINTDWALNLTTANYYYNSIAIGCGIENNTKRNFNPYTNFVYKKILSKNYIHSTRDERTKLFLNKLGFKAINTGCPTMWMLNNEHCSKIPIKKSQNVIFTLTDYCKDLENDQKLIDLLVKKYKKVYFWVQGSGDLEYFNSLSNIENIEIVNPNLESFGKILDIGNIDYVGTRLHAGIYAMQHFVRSIILIVDNRAKDIKETYNIVAVNRSNIEKLSELIDSNFETKIHINEDGIKKWKGQFFDE